MSEAFDSNLCHGKILSIARVCMLGCPNNLLRLYLKNDEYGRFEVTITATNYAFREDDEVEICGDVVKWAPQSYTWRPNYFKLVKLTRCNYP